MNVEAINAEVVLSEEQCQYVFVVDADLAHVGGGSGVVNY